MSTAAPAGSTSEDQTSSPVGPLVVASFQIAIGVIGVLGNGLCFSVLRHQSRTNNTNWLIINQCVADLITSLLLVVATVHLQWFASPPRSQGFGAELYCRMWDSRIVYFTGFAISSFNLTLISLERYFAVLHPVLYMARFKRRTMYLLATAAWLTAPTLQLVMLFVQFDYDSGQCKYIYTGPTIGVVVFFWEYFIPVAIMSYCFICITFKLRALNRVSNTSIEANSCSAGPPTASVNDDGASIAKTEQLSVAMNDRNNALVITASAVNDRNHAVATAAKSSKAQGNVRRRNITITLFIIYLTYLVCWTPNQFVFLVFNFGKIPNYLGSTWHIFTTILATLNICVNPVVYALRYKDFRRGLKEKFACCIRQQ